MAIDWLDIGKIVGLSAIVGSLANAALEHFVTHRRKWKSERNYLAIRLIVVLERFSVDCAEAISQSYLAEQSKGGTGDRIGEIPTIGGFPNDADWKALDPILAERVLSFPTQLELAKHYIAGLWHTSDEDYFYEDVQCRTASYGLDVWSLALDLRNLCKVPASNLNKSGWDFIDSLRETVRTVDERRKKRAESYSPF